MGDEQYYLIVEEELKDEKIDKALWAKASALGKGDEQVTRSRYIQMRVEILKEEAIQITREATKEKVKAEIKYWSILSAKVISGVAVVAFLIILVFEITDNIQHSRQHYMNEKINNKILVCSNDEGEKYVREKVARRDINQGLEKANKLLFSKEYGTSREEITFIPFQLTEEQKKSGYFTYEEYKMKQSDITHHFIGVDYEYYSFSPPSDNDKITQLTFKETEGNTYHLTQSEHLRKDPQTEKITEYNCISD